MVAYVLLIGIGITLALIVFFWLKQQVPNPQEFCPSDIAVNLEDYRCPETSSEISIDLRNMGLFDIRGIVVKANYIGEGKNPISQMVYLGLETPEGEEENSLDRARGIAYETIAPGEIEENLRFYYDSEKNLYGISIQPFIMKENKIVLCDEAIIKQDITGEFCPSGRVEPPDLPECSCSDWFDDGECGENGCPEGEKRQARECLPSGCLEEERCISCETGESCTNGETESCTAANGCAGTRTCSNNIWGSCSTNLINCPPCLETCPVIPGAPVVTLISPENNQEKSPGNIDFSYRVTDIGNTDNLANCTMILDGREFMSRLNVPQYDDQTFTVNLGTGSYIWRVKCRDNENLVGYSEARTLIVNADTDGDGIDDIGDIDDDNDGIIDALDPDDDNDGILDIDEGSGDVDSDGDGIPDSIDNDDDNDLVMDFGGDWIYQIGSADDDDPCRIVSGTCSAQRDVIHIAFYKEENEKVRKCRMAFLIPSSLYCYDFTVLEGSSDDNSSNIPNVALDIDNIFEPRGIFAKIISDVKSLYYFGGARTPISIDNSVNSGIFPDITSGLRPASSLQTEHYYTYGYVGNPSQGYPEGDEGDTKFVTSRGAGSGIETVLDGGIGNYLDSSGNVDYSDDFLYGRFQAIAISPDQKTAYIAVQEIPMGIVKLCKKSYTDYTSGNPGAWNCEIVDSAINTNNAGDGRIELFVDKDNKIHLLYLFYTNNVNALYYSTNRFGAWNKQIITGSKIGRGRLLIKGDNLGNVYILYPGVDYYDTKLNRWADTSLNFLKYKPDGSYGGNFVIARSQDVDGIRRIIAWGRDMEINKRNQVAVVSSYIYENGRSTIDYTPLTTIDTCCSGMSYVIEEDYADTIKLKINTG